MLITALRSDFSWISKIENNIPYIAAIFHPDGKSALQNYLQQQYYLLDPVIYQKPKNIKSLWQIDAGSDCLELSTTQFLQDLNQQQQIKDFISIRKILNNQCYCFRFFTKEDKFIFMNNLINNMGSIKIILDLLIKYDNLIEYQDILAAL
jgi:hypothetical protein